MHTFNNELLSLSVLCYISVPDRDLPKSSLIECFSLFGDKSQANDSIEPREFSVSGSLRDRCDAMGAAGEQ